MKVIFLVGVLLVLWADHALSAAAPSPVTCGATLKGRTYSLSADLDCSNAAAPITVTDRAVLNLNNRVYVGSIVLDGRRAHLRDGTVQCILVDSNGQSVDSRCVRVEGSGRHRVENLVVRYENVGGGFGIGIWVLSDGNSFTGNTLFQTPEAGILVLGNDNVLQQNRAIRSNLGAGFHVSGDGNQIIGNYATVHHAGYSTDGANNVFTQNVYAGGSDEASATDEGFGIAGSGNQLSRNVVTDEDYGIFVFTGSHTITNNIAMGNGIDLLDSTTDCAANVWENNVFQTSNQSCIGGNSAALVKSDPEKNFSALLVRMNQWNPKRDRSRILP